MKDIQPNTIFSCNRCLMAIFLLFLLTPPFSIAYEITKAPGETTTRPVETTVEKLSFEELETLLAPIALYPDDLLAQILTASTHPLDVVKAAQYQQQNRGFTEPPRYAMEAWEPSVVSLMMFPETLKMMSDHFEWTEQLGAAIYAQEADVYETIQVLRSRAEANGLLQSNDKQVVVVEKEVIRIVPANPEIIYVPIYDPQVFYMSSYSSPVPWITYGFGISVGYGLSYAFDWHLRNVVHHRHWSRPRHHRHHYYRRYPQHYPGRPGGAWLPPPPIHRPGFHPGHSGRPPGYATPYPPRRPHPIAKPPGYRPPRPVHPGPGLPGYGPRPPRPPHAGPGQPGVGPRPPRPPHAGPGQPGVGPRPPRPPHAGPGQPGSGPAPPRFSHGGPR